MVSEEAPRACPLRDFIRNTAEEGTGEALAKEFLDEPFRVGTRHDLSCEQIIILLQREPDKIRAALEEEGCEESELTWYEFGLASG